MLSSCILSVLPDRVLPISVCSLWVLVLGACNYRGDGSLFHSCFNLFASLQQVDVFDGLALMQRDAIAALQWQFGVQQFQACIGELQQVLFLLYALPEGDGDAHLQQVQVRFLSGDGQHTHGGDMLLQSGDAMLLLSHQLSHGSVQSLSCHINAVLLVFHLLCDDVGQALCGMVYAFSHFLEMVYQEDSSCRGGFDPCVRNHVNDAFVAVVTYSCDDGQWEVCHILCQFQAVEA